MSLADATGWALKQLEIRVLPAGADPITILHISDIHLAPWQKRKARWISKLADLNPDLVVNTGDNLGHREAIDPLLEALAPLLKLPGVFVNGSNDYHAPEPRNPLAYLGGPSKPTLTAPLETHRMTTAFAEAGWLDLNNESGWMNVAGTAIGFMGLDDPHEQLDDISGLWQQAAEIGGRAAELELQEPLLRIGVAHAPYMRVIEAFARHEAQLIFAGHTHGGQICLPGGRALVTNSDLPPQHARGLSAWRFGTHDSMLHVSGGIGTSIYAPVRLFCKPEASLITLSATR